MQNQILPILFDAERYYLIPLSFIGFAIFLRLMNAWTLAIFVGLTIMVVSRLSGIMPIVYNLMGNTEFADGLPYLGFAAIELLFTLGMLTSLIGLCGFVLSIRRKFKQYKSEKVV